MTPQEFIARREKHRAIIAKAEELIQQDYEEAQKCSRPDSLRTAQQSDFVNGAIIWRDGGEDDWYWMIVEVPMYQPVPEEGFIDEEGCYYPLNGSYVEQR